MMKVGILNYYVDITETELEELKTETQEQLKAFMDLEKRLEIYKVKLNEEDMEKRNKLKQMASGIFSVSSAKEMFDNSILNY